MPTFADQVVDAVQSLPAGRLHDESPHGAAAQHQLLTTAATAATATPSPSTSRRCWHCRNKWLRCCFPCLCGTPADNRDPDQRYGAQHHVGQAAPCHPGPSPAAQARYPSAPHSQDTGSTNNPTQEALASSSGRGIRAPGVSAAGQEPAGVSGLWRRAFGLGAGSSPRRPASGGKSSSSPSCVSTERSCAFRVCLGTPCKLSPVSGSMADLLRRFPSCLYATPMDSLDDT